MTWHQWHQTAEIDRRMGRSRVAASPKAFSDHGRHLISLARLCRGEKWNSLPASRGGRPRGDADDKADVMARIHALETLKGLGEIPVTLRFLVEGEEEIGSMTFEKIAHEHADKLRADGCLWESGASFDPAGRPTLQFGCRGLLYVQLRVKMLDFDHHSGLASIYPSAAMYLVEALASLRDQDMNIRIDGFYERMI